MSDSADKFECVGCHELIPTTTDHRRARTGYESVGALRVHQICADCWNSGRTGDAHIEPGTAHVFLVQH